MGFLIRKKGIAVAVFLTAIFGVCNLAYPQTPSAVTLEPKPKHPLIGRFMGARLPEIITPACPRSTGRCADLEIVWKFDVGEEGGLETSPIVVGRILYAYTATQKVVALDAATGSLIWKFDSGIVGRVRSAASLIGQMVKQADLRLGHKFFVRTRRSNGQTN